MELKSRLLEASPSLHRSPPLPASAPCLSAYLLQLDGPGCVTPGTGTLLLWGALVGSDSIFPVPPTPDMAPGLGNARRFLRKHPIQTLWTRDQGWKQESGCTESQRESISAPQLSPKGRRTPTVAVTTGHSQLLAPGEPRRAGFFSHIPRIPWTPTCCRAPRPLASPGGLVSSVTSLGSPGLLRAAGLRGPCACDVIQEGFLCMPTWHCGWGPQCQPTMFLELDEVGPVLSQHLEASGFV